MTIHRSFCIAAAAWAALGACAVAAAATPTGHRVERSRYPVARHGVGLGPVLPSKFGGEIFGWDLLDQNGNDGLLTESVFEPNGEILNGIETFDERKAVVTKVVRKTITPASGPEPVVAAIVGNDVGLVDDERDFVRNDRIVRDDLYPALDPVAGNKITGKWRPPGAFGFRPNFVTNNQASPSQAVLGFKTNIRGLPEPRIYTYDSATGAFGQPFVFPYDQILADYLLYAAVQAATNEIVVGYRRNSAPTVPTSRPRSTSSTRARAAGCARSTGSARALSTAWPSTRRPIRSVRRLRT